jgi:hypothetical protein
MVCSKSGSVRPPNIFNFFKVVLAIQDLLRVLMNFGMDFSLSSKKFYWDIEVVLTFDVVIDMVMF